MIVSRVQCKWQNLFDFEASLCGILINPPMNTAIVLLVLINSRVSIYRSMVTP